MLLELRTTSAAIRRIGKTRWSFKKAAWLAFHDECEAAFAEAGPEHESVQELATRFHGVLQRASKRHIPRGSRADAKPWAWTRSWRRPWKRDERPDGTCAAATVPPRTWCQALNCQWRQRSNQRYESSVSVVEATMDISDVSWDSTAAVDVSWGTSVAAVDVSDGTSGAVEAGRRSPAVTDVSYYSALVVLASNQMSSSSAATVCCAPLVAAESRCRSVSCFGTRSDRVQPDIRCPASVHHSAAAFTVTSPGGPNLFTPFKYSGIWLNLTVT